jgi:hypothetical protein
VKVELLYFEGCPNAIDYLPELTALLASAGITTPVDLVLIRDEQDAVEQRFLGSPTVRINGRDIETAAKDRRDYALTCRLYPGPAGVTGRPSAQLIRSAAARLQPVRPPSVRR